MTKPFLFLGVLACAAVVTAFAVVTSPPPSNTIMLTWPDYSTNYAVDAFKVYTSPRPDAPLTNWALVGTVSGSIRAITISNLSQESYFYATSSNWLGESRPSNVVGTPELLSDVKLQILLLK